VRAPFAALFRGPGSYSELEVMHQQLVSEKADPTEVFAGTDDRHLIASLLLRWVRETCGPLIPPEFVPQCALIASTGEKAEAEEQAEAQGTAPRTLVHLEAPGGGPPAPWAVHVAALMSALGDEASGLRDEVLRPLRELLAFLQKGCREDRGRRRAGAVVNPGQAAAGRGGSRHGAGRPQYHLRSISMALEILG
jgi:hypothetical protein